MHDPTKVLLGATQSSAKDISTHSSDPATFVAGLAVRLSNTGDLSLSSGAGSFLGVSLGKSLSDTKKTSVVRTGEGVPLQLTDDGVAASIKKGDITFTAKEKGVAGNSITIALLDTLEDGTANVEVEGLDIIVNIESTVTIASAIKTAIDNSPEASALISAVIDGGDESAAQSAAAEDNLENGADAYSYVVKGQPVYIDNSTGKADVQSGSTISGAMYVSGPLDGVAEDGTDVKVALVDMPGGL